MKSSFVLVVFLFIATACAPVTGQQGGTTEGAVSGATLSAQPSGNTVRLTLTNSSDAQLGYNLCSSLLERREGGAWREVRTDEVCTMELRMLAPGASATFDKTWPATAGSGEFRYRTRVEMPLGGGSRDLATEPFTR